MSADKGIHTEVPAMMEISLEQVLLVSAIKVDVLASYANKGNLVRASNPYNHRFLWRITWGHKCSLVSGMELNIPALTKRSTWGLLGKLLRRKESHLDK